MSAQTSLKDYVYAGYPAIVLNTSEEERAIENCLKIAYMARMKLYVWSETKGVLEYIYEKNNGNISQKDTETKPSPDDEALRQGLTYGNDVIYCMLDFHPYIKAPAVWRTAKDVFSTAKSQGVIYIFISSKFDVPPELEHEVIVTDFDLPKKDDLRKIAIELCKAYQVEIPSNIDDAVDAALGLTMFEAENAFATSFSKTHTFDIDIKRIHTAMTVDVDIRQQFLIDPIHQ